MKVAPHLRAVAHARILFVAMSVVISAPISAQRPDTARTASHTPLLTRRDAVVAGLFVATTVVLMPTDLSVAHELQEPDWQRRRILRDGATGFRFMGGSGALLASGVLYGVGRIGHLPRAADLGLHALEAMALGGAMTGLVKGAVGRARPYAVHDADADNLQFLRGFRGGAAYASFPSGHTTTGFAAAAAATAEMTHWWPRAKWVIAPALYGSATLIGLSRLYNNDHWASDVALAAGIGTLSGLTVVRYNHRRPQNRLNRWLLGTTVTHVPTGGYAIGWSLPH